jgi:Na+/melibiose symporter-like transporter
MTARVTNPPITFRASKSERTAYGFYFFGQNVFYIVVLNFLQIFLTDQGITAAAVATIFLRNSISNNLQHSRGVCHGCVL